MKSTCKLLSFINLEDFVLQVKNVAQDIAESGFL